MKDGERWEEAETETSKPRGKENNEEREEVRET